MKTKIFTRHLGLLYQKAGCKVFGIDASLAMMDMARKRLGEDADLRLGDAADMPHSDNTFDLITATMTLHEMRQPTRLAVLTEAKRVLKKEGRILVIDFHPGKLRGLKSITNKVIIFISEVLAGKEHFKNFRHFMKYKGIPTLAADANLSIDIQKIVSGGTLGLYLLQS